MTGRADNFTEEDLILIATALPSIALPSHVQARVLARIQARIAGAASAAERESERDGEAGPTLRTLRRGDGDWLPMAPAVEYKVLHDDGAFASMLVRLQAGARLPPHGHPGTEECYVVSGDIWLSGVHLQAGDFQLAGIGVTHEEIHSEGGCLLHLRACSGVAAAAPSP